MLIQGLKNQDAEVSIPDGYRVAADSTNIIKIPDYEYLDTVQDIKSSRIINVNVHLIDGNQVVAAHTYQTIANQPINVNDLLPDGYSFVGKSTFNAESDGQTINVYVQENSSS